jgi:hypothetical protein
VIDRERKWVIFFMQVKMRNHMEAFFFDRVIVVYVIRHYDASLRNEPQIHNVWKHIGNKSEQWV